MSNLSLNQNTFSQTPILAQVTNDPQPQTFSAQIYQSSTAAVISAGQTVKLVDTAGPNIIVDVCASASDGPVFGVIANVLRKNRYSAGDYVTVVGPGGVLMLKSSEAVTRGAVVTGTNQTVTTNDPTQATAVTAGDYVSGVALTPASGANVLFKVKVQPGIISATGPVVVSIQ